MSGIGSLITFQGLTQGVLQTAARTIQSALDIEKAAAVSAQTPVPVWLYQEHRSRFTRATSIWITSSMEAKQTK
jgi:hypothetical protein